MDPASFDAFGSVTHGMGTCGPVLPEPGWLHPVIAKIEGGQTGYGCIFIVAAGGDGADRGADRWIVIAGVRAAARGGIVLHCGQAAVGDGAGDLLVHGEMEEWRLESGGENVWAGRVGDDVKFVDIPGLVAGDDPFDGPGLEYQLVAARVGNRPGIAGLGDPKRVQGDGDQLVGVLRAVPGRAIMERGADRVDRGRFAGAGSHDWDVDRLCYQVKR